MLILKSYGMNTYSMLVVSRMLLVQVMDFLWYFLGKEVVNNVGVIL